MVNLNKLKGKIVECGYTVESLCKQIGINKSTFYRKLKKEAGDFSIKEANLIADTLKLTNSEAAAIFFAQSIA